MLAYVPAPAEAAAYALRDHHNRFGRYPNLLHPKGFNDRVMRRRLFDNREIFRIWADKAQAREYAGKRIGWGSLPRLYHLTDDPATIPWPDLPRQYVIKATHGSGWVHVVQDKYRIDREAILAELREWLATNYYDLYHELIYRKIKPQILIEEFLDDGRGESAWDYKCYTYHGRVHFIQVDVGRFTGEMRNIYTHDWELLPMRLGPYQNYDPGIPRPERLAELLSCAETLAGDTNFVRADLYIVDNVIKFGEMTSSCCGGLNRFNPPEFDVIFGAPWELSQSRRGLTWSGVARTG